MPHQGTRGAPDCGGANITKLIKAYDTLSSRTGTNVVANKIIASFPYNSWETMQEMLKTMSGYVKKDWEQLKEGLKDTFHHTNSQD